MFVCVCSTKFLKFFFNLNVRKINFRKKRKKKLGEKTEKEKRIDPISYIEKMKKKKWSSTVEKK